MFYWDNINEWPQVEQSHFVPTALRKLSYKINSDEHQNNQPSITKANTLDLPTVANNTIDDLMHNSQNSTFRHHNKEAFTYFL
jgi:hypothetical protein